MRLSSQISKSATLPQPPARRVFSFTCACCGITENRPGPDAPAGWAVGWIDGESFALCPQDVIHRPDGDVQ